MLLLRYLGDMWYYFLVLYEKDKKLYAANPGGYTPGSYSSLKAGRICAIIGITVSALTIISAIISFMTLGVSLFEQMLKQMQQRQ